MIEPTDRAAKEAQARHRRRKSAAWKSGLVLTGLGGVVLGAGYLAGVNAPAVAQTSTPQAVAQAAPASATNQNSVPSQSSAPSLAPAADEDNVLRVPQTSDSSQPGLFMGYDESGNAVYLTNDGQLVIGGSNSAGSSSQLNPQSGSQSTRRSRGFTQQQPNFSRPMTRSRGS